MSRAVKSCSQSCQCLLHGPEGAKLAAATAIDTPDMYELRLDRDAAQAAAGTLMQRDDDVLPVRAESDRRQLELFELVLDCHEYVAHDRTAAFVVARERVRCSPLPADVRVEVLGDRLQVAGIERLIAEPQTLDSVLKGQRSD